MSFCKPAYGNTAMVYTNCYMHASGTDDPVSDTAAGGWNRDTV
jgi:hypothetical protein